MASVIKSVQQVSITIPSTSSTGTATISSVVTANTVVLPQGYTSTNTGNVRWGRDSGYVQLTNSTTVTATVGSTGDTIVVNAVVVEFASDVNSIQSGTIVVPSGSSTATATLGTAVGANAFVLLNGFVSSSSSIQLQLISPSVVLTSSTVVTATTGGTTGNTTVAYTVVDLDSTIISSIAAYNLTDSTTSTSYTQTITSVTPADTLLIYNGIVVGSGTAVTADNIDHTLQLTNATTVTLTRSGANVASRNIFWTVVQFQSGVLSSNAVQRGTVSIAAATSGTATIPASVNTSFAFCNWCGQEGSGTNINSSQGTQSLTNSTTVTSTYTTATTMTTSWEVIEFSSSSGTTVALTGLTAATTLTSLTPALSKPFGALSATTTQGSLSTALSGGLGALSAAAAFGSLSVAEQFALAHLSAATAFGTPSGLGSDQLTGLTASTTFSSLSEAIKFALGALAATSSFGALTEANKAALTGLTASTAFSTLSEAIKFALGVLAANTTLGSVTVSTSGNTNVALGALAATATLGALSEADKAALTGLTATSSFGTLSESINFALGVLAANTTLTSITVSTSSSTNVTLSTLAAAASLGILTPADRTVLNSLTAATAQGNVSDILANGLSSLAATSSLTGPSISVSGVLAALSAVTALDNLTVTIETVDLSGLAAVTDLQVPLVVTVAGMSGLTGTMTLGVLSIFTPGKIVVGRSVLFPAPQRNLLVPATKRNLLFPNDQAKAVYGPLYFDPKDPDDVDFFTSDLSVLLGLIPGDTIASGTAIVTVTAMGQGAGQPPETPPALTVVSGSVFNSPTAISAQLQGGTPGVAYQVSYQFQTVQRRTLRRTAAVQVTIPVPGPEGA